MAIEHNKKIEKTQEDKNQKKNNEIIIDKSISSEKRPATAPANKCNDINDDNKTNDYEIKINASHPSASSIIPEQISMTLEHIVNQLSIVTQTLGVFEE
eukprot:UN10448